MTILLILLTAAAASAPQGLPATRAEVAAQRAAIEQRFLVEKAECEQRFVVSACLEEARKRRQDGLGPLTTHEHELAAQERHARAAAQAQLVKERELAAAQEESRRQQRRVSAPPPAAPSTPASHPLKARSPEQVEREGRVAASQAAQEAAKRRDRTQEREAHMRQRQAEHEAKEKARTKPLAAPLPLPGASSPK